MSSRIFQFLLLIALNAFTTAAHANSDFKAVYDATKTIIAGRVFINEDGTKLMFSSIRLTSLHRAELTAELFFPDGQGSSHREVIISNGTQVRLDQLIDGRVAGSYHVSIEPPFHVLRIRPLNSVNTNFISRECVFQESENIHLCYIKTRIDNEVFVTVFRELKNP